MWYLFCIAAGLCAAYVLFLFVFPLLFKQPMPRLRPRSLLVLPVICAASIAVTYWSISLPGVDLGDRLMHLIGGGALGVAVCFLAVKNSGLALNRMQFVILAGLVVTALGVANEIAEFTLQSAGAGIFAASIDDTWLDLVSNTAGIFLGLLVLAPFI